MDVPKVSSKKSKTYSKSLKQLLGFKTQTQNALLSPTLKNKSHLIPPYVWQSRSHGIVFKLVVNAGSVSLVRIPALDDPLVSQ